MINLSFIGSPSELLEYLEYEIAKAECDHDCTSNCRREGCNCACGEWHEGVE